MSKKRLVQAGGMRGTVFKEVSRLRLEDASVLLQNKRYGGAIYLAGYAIECFLKWAITRRQNTTYLSERLEIHNWDKLLIQTGLQQSLSREPLMHAIYSELAEVWGPELRYNPHMYRRREAEMLYGKLRQLYNWLVEHAL